MQETMTSTEAERLAKREAEDRARQIERETRPTVSDREDRIGKALDQLEGALAVLTEQLGPVLAEPELAPVAPALAEQPAPSLHAQRLAHMAEWTERLVGEVRTLTHRVDL